MSVAQILSKARAMGVRLSLNGDGVKLRGPADSVASIKPEIAAHKPALLAYLRRSATEAAVQAHCPVENGPPMSPYVVPMPIERVAELLADLREAINRLADIEAWPVGYRDDLLQRVCRTPPACLEVDLHYFRGHLEAWDAARRVTDAARHTEANRMCATCRHRKQHRLSGHYCELAQALRAQHIKWIDAPDVVNPCSAHKPKPD